MSAEKILIVEDEKKIARIIQLELEHEGYETETATTSIVSEYLSKSSAVLLFISFLAFSSRIHHLKRKYP